MDELIEALQIFKKYKNEKYPTHCEHDVLWIMGVGQDEMSKEDTDKVNELGFIWSESYDSWISFRFGSA